MSQTVKTWVLSGMPFGYEEGCQKMLWTGIKYLSKIDNAKDIFRGMHETILKANKDANLFGVIPVKKGEIIDCYGILNTPESCMELESEMMKAVNDCTGAMHQCVMGHLRFIAEHGLEKWHQELKDARKDDQPLQFDLDTMTLLSSERGTE